MATAAALPNTKTKKAKQNKTKRTNETKIKKIKINKRKPGSSVVVAGTDRIRWASETRVTQLKQINKQKTNKTLAPKISPAMIRNKSAKEKGRDRDPTQREREKKTIFLFFFKSRQQWPFCFFSLFFWTQKKWLETKGKRKEVEVGTRNCAHSTIKRCDQRRKRHQSQTTRTRFFFFFFGQKKKQNKRPAKPKKRITFCRPGVVKAKKTQ